MNAVTLRAERLPSGPGSFVALKNTVAQRLRQGGLVNVAAKPATVRKAVSELRNEGWGPIVSVAKAGYMMVPDEPGEVFDVPLYSPPNDRGQVTSALTGDIIEIDPELWPLLRPQLNKARRAEPSNRLSYYTPYFYGKQAKIVERLADGRVLASSEIKAGHPTQVVAKIRDALSEKVKLVSIQGIGYRLMPAAQVATETINVPIYNELKREGDMVVVRSSVTGQELKVNSEIWEKLGASLNSCSRVSNAASEWQYTPNFNPREAQVLERLMTQTIVPSNSEIIKAVMTIRPKLHDPIEITNIHGVGYMLRIKREAVSGQPIALPLYKFLRIEGSYLVVQSAYTGQELQVDAQLWKYLKPYLNCGFEGTAKEDGNILPYFTRDEAKTVERLLKGQFIVDGPKLINDIVNIRVKLPQVLE